MPNQSGEALSPAAIAELESDHLAGSPPDDDIAIEFRMFAEPVSEATALGSAVLANAVKYLQIPLREDAGVNEDKAGHIRSFFLQGLKWNPDLWDHWMDKHPRSKVAKPEWCAAFGSYCVRKAYADAGQPLPARLAASAADLRVQFLAAGRFVSREEIFCDDGPIRAEARTLPGPGDLVVFQGHVGMLRELYADGAFVTIEGNTYKNQPRRDGVYQCNRSAAQKKDDGTFKLVGFCLLPSIDGLIARPAGAPPVDAAEPAPVGESAGEPDPSSAGS